MVERNVGGWDRRLRGVGAVGALLAAGWLATAGNAAGATMAGVVAAGLGFNAVTGFCGANRLLGVDTCSVD